MKLSEMSMILLHASALYQNATLSEPTIRMWHSLFEEEAAHKFKAAFLALVKQSGRVFFPTPGEVVGMLRTMQSNDLPAEELWVKACEVASSGCDSAQMSAHMGRYSKRAVAALNSIGWDRVRYADLESEIHFVRRDFLAAMEGYQKNEELEISKDDAKRMLSQIATDISGANRRRLAGFQPLVAGAVQASGPNNRDNSLPQSARGEFQKIFDDIREVKSTKT